MFADEEEQRQYDEWLEVQKPVRKSNTAKKSSAISKSVQRDIISNMSNDLHNNANRYGKEAAKDPNCRQPALVGILVGGAMVGDEIGFVISGFLAEIDNYNKIGTTQYATEALFTAGNYKAATQLTQTQGELMAWDCVGNTIYDFWDSIPKVTVDEMIDNYMKKSSRGMH